MDILENVRGAAMMFFSRRSRMVYLAGILGSMAFLAQTCYAARWKEIGQLDSGSAGVVYVDLDSIREDGGYRIALFLTIYAAAAANIHSIRLDRISQETAFDCAKRTFALLYTIGYFEGKEVGKSSDKSNWKDGLKAMPQDGFSQRAYDVACNSPLASHPEDGISLGDTPGSVKLSASGAGDH
jgi:Surface-adhesin protein E